MTRLHRTAINQVADQLTTSARRLMQGAEQSRAVRCRLRDRLQLDRYIRSVSLDAIRQYQ